MLARIVIRKYFGHRRALTPTFFDRVIPSTASISSHMELSTASISPLHWNFLAMHEPHTSSSRSSNWHNVFISCVKLFIVFNISLSWSKFKKIVQQCQPQISSPQEIVKYEKNIYINPKTEVEKKDTWPTAKRKTTEYVLYSITIRRSSSLSNSRPTKTTNTSMENKPNIQNLQYLRTNTTKTTTNHTYTTKILWHQNKTSTIYFMVMLTTPNC